MGEADHTPPADPRKAAIKALADFDQQQADRVKVQKAREAERKKQKRLRTVFQWAVVVVCLGIVGYQLPGLVDVLGGREKPLRRGTMDTGALTDRCIANLWRVSEQIQQGGPVGKGLVCPASGLPFEIVKTEDDVVARSPRPELYGYREIRVSKKKPVPEVIQ